MGDFSGVVSKDYDTSLWTVDSDYKPLQDGRIPLKRKGQKQRRKKDFKPTHKKMRTRRGGNHFDQRTVPLNSGTTVENVPRFQIPLSERQQIALLMTMTDDKLDKGFQNIYSETDSHTENMTKVQTKKKIKDTAILCTEDQVDAARELTRQFNSDVQQATVITCQDLVHFTENVSQLHEHHSFYILVGSSITSLLMTKGRLHDCVYDFFQAIEEQQKDVYVLDKLQKDEDSDLVFEFFYQLPKKCRKWYKEIQIKRLSKEDFEQGVTAEDHSEKPSPPPREDMATSLENPFDYQRDEDVDEEDDDDETDEETESQNIQVGSNLRMNICTDSNRQLIFAKQEGPRNNMQINIVPPSTKSRLKLVMKSKPTNEEIEEEILCNVKEEVLQINLETTGASNFVVKKGSIIIEMDVEPGQTMDYEWICRLLRLIFKDKIARALAEGTSLDIEVERQVVVSPKEFESMTNDSLHLLCVPKEKHDALQKLYEDTKQELEETMKNENLHSSCVPMEKHESLLLELKETKSELEETMKNENLHSSCVPMEKHESLLLELKETKSELEETMKNENLHSSCVPMEKHESLLLELKETRSELEAFRTYSCMGTEVSSKVTPVSAAEEWKIADPVKSEWPTLEYSFSSSSWAMDESIRDYEASIKSESTSVDDVQYEELLVELEETKKELEALKKSTGRSTDIKQEPIIAESRSSFSGSSFSANVSIPTYSDRQITSILKQEMKERILDNHRTVKEPIRPQITRLDKLSPLDEERRMRRREQNRRAARMCRKKKLVQSKTLEKAVKEVVAQNTKCNEDLEHLRKQKDELEKILTHHEQCHESCFQGTVEHPRYHVLAAPSISECADAYVGFPHYRRPQNINVDGEVRVPVTEVEFPLTDFSGFLQQ